MKTLFVDNLPFKVSVGSDKEETIVGWCGQFVSRRNAVTSFARQARRRAPVSGRDVAGDLLHAAIWQRSHCEIVVVWVGCLIDFWQGWCQERERVESCYYLLPLLNDGFRVKEGTQAEEKFSRRKLQMVGLHFRASVRRNPQASRADFRSQWHFCVIPKAVHVGIPTCSFFCETKWQWHFCGSRRRYM